MSVVPPILSIPKGVFDDSQGPILLSCFFSPFTGDLSFVEVFVFFIASLRVWIFYLPLHNAHTDKLQVYRVFKF